MLTALQCLDQPALIHRSCPGDDLDFPHPCQDLFIRQCGKSRSCDDIGFAIGFLPQTNLPADFPGGAWRVACHNLHSDTGIETGLHRIGHIITDRIRNGGNPHKGQVAGNNPAFHNCGFLFTQHLIGKPQCPHRLALIGQ